MTTITKEYINKLKAKSNDDLSYLVENQKDTQRIIL